MFYKYKIILPFLFILCVSNAFAQGELQTEREPDKYNLNSYGIKINSNGYGLYYNFSHRINYRLRNFIESEYNYQKHPKEIKVINGYLDAYSVRKFVFGKTHTVHNIKVGYGYNKMIYEKRDKNSVSIHLIGSAGIIMAISKPIYYEIVDSIKYSNNYPIPMTSFHKIDINFQNNPSDILGKAPFSYGFNELKFHPGLYAKAGLQFDFSQNVMQTQVLETGVILDSYLIPVEIMAGQESHIYVSLYIAYHFGKKYDYTLNREYRKDQRRVR